MDRAASLAPSTGGITFRRPCSSPKFGFLVGTPEAHSSPQQLSGSKKWCREENQMPASPTVLTGPCRRKHQRTPSRGTRAHRRAGVCITGRMCGANTLTFPSNTVVRRNLKLNILSTYTKKNPFIETKSTWRSKDRWPEMKYFKNKIHGD